MMLMSSGDIRYIAIHLAHNQLIIDPKYDVLFFSSNAFAVWIGEQVAPYTCSLSVNLPLHSDRDSQIKVISPILLAALGSILDPAFQLTKLMQLMFHYLVPKNQPPLTQSLSNTHTH
jgi:hypothetical protein